MEFQFKSHFRRLTWFLPTLKLWRVLVHGVTFRAAAAAVSAEAGFQCCPNHCLLLLCYGLPLMQLAQVTYSWSLSSKASNNTGGEKNICINNSRLLSCAAGLLLQRCFWNLNAFLVTNKTIEQMSRISAVSIKLCQPPMHSQTFQARISKYSKRRNNSCVIQKNMFFFLKLICNFLCVSRIWL